MDTNSEKKLPGTSPKIQIAAEAVTEKLLPPKSVEKYTFVYNMFMTWCQASDITSVSENVLLEYFDEPSKTLAPSTLWARYSMLKSTLNVKQKINIESYHQLTAFLKRKSDGHRGKKAKTLTSEDVEKLLNDAPDQQYLAIKVALVFGVLGACRREEITNTTINDVTSHGSMLLVKILNTKTKIPRSFTIDGKFHIVKNIVKYFLQYIYCKRIIVKIDIVKKYQALRPKDATSHRFFSNYAKGKYTNQPIGVNKFGAMPQQIAEYLNLPDASSYTGHAFRRTSATLLADSGANITTIKQHGGWKSTSVPEGYIENSVNNKREISHSITESININASTSNDNSDLHVVPLKQSRIEQTENIEVADKNTRIFHLTNCNVTIN